MRITNSIGTDFESSNKMNHSIPICLIDTKSLRRHRIAKSVGKAGYEIYELSNFEEFLNCDLAFSLVIIAQDGSDWHDLRMLCAAANVPVIVLALEDQWTRLSALHEVGGAHNTISVSHIDTDEIVWRIEAFTLRSTGRSPMKMSRKEFTWGDHRFINGAHCVDLMCAHS